MQPTTFKYLLVLHLHFIGQFPGAVSFLCDVNLDDVKFLLYTRENQNNSIVLNPVQPKNVPDKSRTMVIIHGYFSTSKSFGLPAMKDAFLKRYDSNVIMMDWGKIAFQNYLVTVCKLFYLSQILANFLCQLTKNNRGITFENLHVVGHSLGAQMSGQASEWIKRDCKKKIDRITGLDPAGPLFPMIFKAWRLDRSDAYFVDVIHTGRLGLGYDGNCGTVDFYVNCGEVQKGCLNVMLTEFPNLFQVVLCSHIKSIKYFTESISSDQFIAQSCDSCPNICPQREQLSTDSQNHEYIVMGEDCPRNSTHRVFFVPVSSKPPYSEGWTPYNKTGNIKNVPLNKNDDTDTVNN